MAAEIGSLVVRVGADTSSLTKGLGEAKSSVSDFGSMAAGVATKVAALGAAAAAAGAAIVVGLVKSGLEAVDAQAKLAQSLGTTTKSIQVLTRAGGLSGVAFSQVEMASIALTRRLSQAAQGTGPAIAALDRLGLSATHLASLPLDERIATINREIERQIPVAERAATASQLFGDRAGVLMQRLSSDTIATATDEVEKFGVALSDVDSTKIEMANDSMTKIGVITEGIRNQLTVGFAPILGAIADRFAEMTVEAGGFATVARDGAMIAARAFGVVADAGRIVHVAFDTLKVGLMVFTAGALKTLDDLVGGVASIANKIPGVKFDYENSGMKLFIDGFIYDTTTATNELATLATSEWPSTGIMEFFDEIQFKANETAAAIVANREALTSIGSDDFIATLEENQEKINESVQAANIKRNKMEADFAKERAKIQAQERREREQDVHTMFGNFSSLMNTGNRKLFEIGKAAAISNALMYAYEGISLTMSKYPYPLNIAMAAAHGAAAFAQISSIRSQQFGGGGAGAMATGSNTAAVNAGSAPVQAPQATTQQTLAVEGLSADSLFSGTMVRALGEKLAEWQKNGGQVVFA